MRASLLPVLLLGLFGAGCATTGTPPPAASVETAVETAEAEPGDGTESLEARTLFIVHHARTGRCDEVEKSLALGVPADTTDSIHQTALIAAASHDHLACARVLLDHGANPNFRDTAGWTPLIFATYFHASEAFLDLLLERGADINHQNDRGVTALYLAAAAGNDAQVAYLLGRGANPHLQTHSGYTALRVAQIKGLAQIAAQLDAPAATPHGSPQP